MKRNNILILFVTFLSVSCSSQDTFVGYKKKNIICKQDIKTKELNCQKTDQFKNNLDYFTESDYEINQIEKPE